MRAKRHEWYVEGRDKGENGPLEVAIELARLELNAARNADERGVAGNDLGIALSALGDRESGAARLTEAVAAYRAALEERKRERVPLDWAATQNNLGIALAVLGEREDGTARLEEAVAAYRAALEERMRGRVPLDWAQTQNNLGNALSRLGEREGGTARLEEAVAAYSAARRKKSARGFRGNGRRPEQSRQRAQNARRTQNGTTRLEEAVAAYRAALREYSSKRLRSAGRRPQNNLGTALRAIGEREKNGTGRFEEAVAAYRAALKDGRVSGYLSTGRRHRAMPAMHSCASASGRAGWLCLRRPFRPTAQRSKNGRASGFRSFNGRRPLAIRGIAQMLIADRANDCALAETAARRIEAALATTHSGGHQQLSAYFHAELTKAQAIRDRLRGR